MLNETMLKCLDVLSRSWNTVKPRLVFIYVLCLVFAFWLLLLQLIFLNSHFFYDKENSQLLSFRCAQVKTSAPMQKLANHIGEITRD